MKKTNSLIIGLLAVLISMIVIVFAITFFALGLFGGQNENGDIGMSRYIAICTNPQAEGWSEIKNGMLYAAEEHGVSVEFIETGFIKDREDASCIEMAVDSGVQGIAVYFQHGDADEELKYAEEKSIPVIAIVGKYDGEKEISCISASSSRLAHATADYIGEMDTSSLRIGIIKNYSFVESWDGLFAGFAAEFLRFPIKTSSGTGSYVFDAGETTRLLLQEDPSINLICCTDANTTLGAAQSIVDLNKVNDVHIMGSGSSAEILGFIEKRIITASLVVDYEKIGKSAIDELVRRNDVPYSTVRNIEADIFMIDDSNVAYHIGRLADEKE